MWSAKSFSTLLRSENISSLLGRHYADFVSTLKPRSPANVSALLLCRTYKGSNRYKRESVVKKRIWLDRQMEDDYGVTTRPEFNQKEWMKQNYFTEFNAFQVRLGIKFNDHRILMSAFAHPSFLEELSLIQRDELSSEEKDMHQRFELKDEVSHVPFQKLSLLGYDTTLLTIKEGLYTKYPNITKKIIEDVSKFLTSRDTITMIAKNLAMEDLLLLSRELDTVKDFSKEYHLQFTKEDLLCDTFYSVVGAIIKDLGNDAAKSFVSDFVTSVMHFEDLAEHVERALTYPQDELRKILELNGVRRGTKALTILESGIDTDFPFVYVGIYCNNYKIGDGSSYSVYKAKIDAFKNTVYKCLEGDIDFSKLRMRRSADSHLTTSCL